MGETKKLPDVEVYECPRWWYRRSYPRRIDGWEGPAKTGRAVARVVKGVEEQREVDGGLLGWGNVSGCVPTDPIDISCPFEERNRGRREA